MKIRVKERFNFRSYMFNEDDVYTVENKGDDFLLILKTNILLSKFQIDKYFIMVPEKESSDFLKESIDKVSSRLYESISSIMIMLEEKIEEINYLVEDKLFISTNSRSDFDEILDILSPYEIRISFGCQKKKPFKYHIIINFEELLGRKNDER